MTTADAILDPRTTLARPDLAEQALEGLVRAAAYRPATPLHCVAAICDIHSDVAGGEAIDQLIFGEAFDGLEFRSDRVWGQARRDGVVGWVDRGSLAEGAPLPGARVAGTSSVLPLNALVSEVQSADHQPIGSFEEDPVAVAERLIGVPHRLGARSSQATDCSGLVQQALYACGRAVPRYPDQQARLGRSVDREHLQRGDLVVWLHSGEAPWHGHSALLLNRSSVLHASGRHGAVVVEPLAQVEARYLAEGFLPAQFRRL